MGNVMVGLGLILAGIILFQVAGTFSLYPAKTEVEFPWDYYALKAVSYFLFVVGAVILVLGYM